MKFNLSKRHIAKTITWRILASTDTFVLSFLFLNDIKSSVAIVSFEFFSKMILYYIHERVWFNSLFKEANKRHLLKTFSWRVVGTLDTVLITWFITGNPLLGFEIGSVEVVSKMILYYLHEKLWYRVNFGLLKRNRLKKIKAYKLNKQYFTSS